MGHFLALMRLGREEQESSRGFREAYRVGLRTAEVDRECPQGTEERETPAGQTGPDSTEPQVTQHSCKITHLPTPLVPALTLGS